MLAEVVAAVVGYLLGTLPTAQVVAARTGHDPTAEGSGNPGASNVYRTAGRRAGALVLAGDLAKGAAAAGIGWAVGGRTVALVCGLAAVLGHVAPLLRRARGGKGVATAAGAVFVAFPLMAAAGMLSWVLVAAVTRLASLASLVALAVVAGGIAVGDVAGAEVAVVAVMAGVVAVRHTGNVVRLLGGRERALGAGGGGS